MTLSKPQTANAPAGHPPPEGFSVYSNGLWMPGKAMPLGVCFNPDCAREFNPTRPWQRYCCAACQRKDEAEFRRIGERCAPALLAHRMGKYERDDVDLRALSAAGRNYLGKVQTWWIEDRARRAAK